MVVDGAALVMLLTFTALGYMRGLFSQAWSLGALVASFFATAPAYDMAKGYLGPDAGETLIGEWILKLAVGLAIYIALLIVGYLIEQAMVERFKVVSVSNRIFGGALGFIKGGLAVVISLWVLSFFLPTVLAGPADPGSKKKPAEKVGAGVGKEADQENARKPGKEEAGAEDLSYYLATSRAAEAVIPYNPLNLLLLARVKPYFPAEATGETKKSIKPPRAVAGNETFKTLVADNQFIEAYRERNYMDILLNPSFHRFVQDRTLLDALEKTR